jgi:hypothetical protein
MCDDLQSAGINAFMDITKGDSSTNFDISLLEWIKSSDFVLMVGSTSFATRSKDPSTLTFNEAVEIGKKKQINSNSVIPVLFEGKFSTSFPAGYQDIIGGRFVLPINYKKELPRVAASILNIAKDKEVSVWLDDYNNEVQAITKSAKLSLQDREQTKSNLEIQQQFWKSCMLVLHSKFTLEQLQRVDGNVNERTILMDKYCNKVLAEVAKCSKTPPPISQQVIMQAEPQLKSFLTTPTSRVLLVFSHHQSSIPHFFDTLALKAWEDAHLMPIFVDITSIDSPTTKCVEKSLQKHGLDEHTIKQAKKEMKFFILVSGFERCGIHTNFYVRNEMSSWSGKVVFSCSVEFQQMNPNIHFYFMPSSLRSHQLPHPEGLITITLGDCESVPAKPLSM